MRAYLADTLSVQRAPATAIEPSVAVTKAAPTTRAIVDFVAYLTGLTGAAIIGRNREARLARARAAVSWIAYRVAERSTTQIGAVLGGRHYSSIVEQLRLADRLLVSDPLFKVLIDLAIDQFRKGEPA